MKLFGDKKLAKDLAKSCNVPVISGSEGVVGDLSEAKVLVNGIGYPVLLKATAGGGGRGIRVCNNDRELEENFEAAMREALKSFGKSDLIIENILKSKHIEIQLLADKHGKIVHLYERDCSIQRRHQKVVEIAPSLNIPKSTLEKLYEDSLKIGKASELVSAATVEFLVDSSFNYYFLEVNPRIQVEHTVTELITGIDIVQSQILIAQGCSIFPVK